MLFFVISLSSAKPELPISEVPVCFLDQSKNALLIGIIVLEKSYRIIINFEKNIPSKYVFFKMLPILSKTSYYFTVLSQYTAGLCLVVLFTTKVGSVFLSRVVITIFGRKTLSNVANYKLLIVKKSVSNNTFITTNQFANITLILHRYILINHVVSSHGNINSK